MRSNVSTVRTDAERAADARRQRRHRARRSRGDVPYRLDLPELDVANAMITSGRMSADATGRRALVEQALVGVVRDWVARWK